jgi:hypothetical protein
MIRDFLYRLVNKNFVKMKNFIIYSKKSITGNLTIEDIHDIRYVTRGFKFAYLINILNIFYAASRRLYMFAFYIVLFEVLFFALISFFPELDYILILIKLCIYIFLAMFAVDIEEYFLSRRGYNAQMVVQAKNEKEARVIIENDLKLSFKEPLKKKKFFIF